MLRSSIWILTTCWRTVCADAKLGKVRLHDLRHMAASHAVMAGEALPSVGKLLGHRRHSTTAGYAHLADTHLVEAAEKVGNIIAQAMNLGAGLSPPRPRPYRGHDRRVRHCALRSLPATCRYWIRQLPRGADQSAAPVLRTVTGR